MSQRSSRSKTWAITLSLNGLCESTAKLLPSDSNIIRCSLAKAADMRLDKLVGQKRERARYPFTITLMSGEESDMMVVIKY